MGWERGGGGGGDSVVRGGGGVVGGWWCVMTRCMRGCMLCNSVYNVM